MPALAGLQGALAPAKAGAGQPRVVKGDSSEQGPSRAWAGEAGPGVVAGSWASLPGPGPSSL